MDTSTMETSEDHTNLGGISRKQMLLNQYRQEQCVQNDKSDKKQKQCQNSNSAEEASSSDSSGTERYVIDEHISSPGSENNVNTEDKVDQQASPSKSNSSPRGELNTDAPRTSTLQGNISPPPPNGKGKKSNPLISDTIKCQVCMAPAAKHVHYGATTCFSCRAFFRRSIQTSQSRNYVCRRQGNCIISPDTRKGCQKCRLETCLKIGMKPGWVLNDDERSRRFRKLLLKKAEKSGINDPETSSRIVDQQQEVNDHNSPTRTRLSPSPTAYSKRRRQDFLPQDNLDNEDENASNYGYKRMYLQLREGQEILDKVNDHTISTSSALQLDEDRDNASRMQFQMQHTIKVENDPDLITTRSERPLKSSEDIREEQRRFPRLEAACSNNSRPHYRDEIVEKSMEFLKNDTAELADKYKNSGSRIGLGQPNLDLYSPTETNGLLDRLDDDMHSTFSTFNPISSATTTSSDFREHRVSLQADYTRGHNSPVIIPINSGYQNNSNSPPRVLSSFQRSMNDSRTLVQSTLPESQSNSTYGRPLPPLLSLNHDCDRADGQMVTNGHAHFSESDQAANTSAHTPKRRIMYSRTSPEPRHPLDSVSTRPLSLATRLEGMFMGPGEDEISVVNDFVSQHDKHYKSINFGEDLIKEMIMSSIFGIPMSANTAISAYRLMVQRVTRVSKHFGDFINLPVKVQGVLLKRNADLVVSLRGAAFFQMKTGLDQILTSLGFEDLETAKNMILTTLKSNSTKEEDYKKIDYNKFNTVQKKADQTEEERRYDHLLSRTGIAVAFNQNLIKILSYVLIFCSDFRDEDIDVIDRTSIEKAQESLILMVQRYIFATYPAEMATTVFTGMMECLGNLRELCFIKSKRKSSQVASAKNSNTPIAMVH